MASALTSQSAAYSDDAAEATVVRAEREHDRYEGLIARAKGITPIPTAVVWPCEAHALAGPVDGGGEKIIARCSSVWSLEFAQSPPKRTSISADVRSLMPRARRRRRPRRCVSCARARRTAS